MSDSTEKSSVEDKTPAQDDAVSNSRLLLQIPGNGCQANGKISHKGQNFLMKSKCKKKQEKSSEVFFTKFDKFVCKKIETEVVLDSPYSDIDSVPQIRRCPKGGGRPSLNSTTNQPVRQITSQNVKDAKKNIEVQGGLWFSKVGKGQTSGVFGRAGIKSVNCSFGKVSCKIKIPESAGMKSRNNQAPESEQQFIEGKKTLDKRVVCLPASSRLMTRALKAMEDAKLRQLSSQNLEQTLSSGESENNVNVKRCVSKLKSTVQKGSVGPELEEEAKSNTISEASLGPSDSQDSEVGVKSEDESCLISSEPAAFNASKLKQENQASEVSAFSKASPFRVKIQEDEDMKEITFKSLEDEQNGKSATFCPDANYKYSTFLMLLKDIHDSREKDGRPLAMEPLPAKKLIKDEPSMISGKDLKGSFVSVKDDDDHCTLPGLKNYGQSKASKQNKTNAKFGPDIKEASGCIVQQRRGISTVPKSKKPSKKSQPVVKKSLNNVFVPPGVSAHVCSRRSHNTQTAACQFLAQDSESRFFGGVPKKRWQKFEPDNENVLHAEIRSDQGPNQPQTLPSGQQSLAESSAGKPNLTSSASTTETSINPVTVTPNTCEVSSFPTGKMSAGRNVIGPYQCCLYIVTLSLSLPESKRIRKPSKRLIEWTEEYDYIFATKKKAKKQPESLPKVFCLRAVAVCSLLRLFYAK